MPYELSKAGAEESKLFFRLDSEAAERHGAICGMQIDFETEQNESSAFRFDCQRHLKTPVFKADLNRVIKHLRNSAEAFGSLQNFSGFCREHEGQTITNDEINAPHAFGVKTQTDGYSYYFRCSPLINRVNIFAYDNRYLLPELAGKHELPNDCFSVLPSTGQLVFIVLGENGYFPSGKSTADPNMNRQIAVASNALLGVTRAQEEAMLAGSMFGWDTPAAKPWNYNQDGKPRPPQAKKNEPER